MAKIVKIICPYCSSDKIDIVRKTSKVSLFVCDECKDEFVAYVEENMWTIEYK